MFLGAGAAAPLMSATGGISKFFTYLFDKEKSKKTIQEKLATCWHKHLPKHLTALDDLFIMLGSENEKDANAAQAKIEEKARLYEAAYKGDFDKIKQNLGELKQIYDWECLNAIIYRSEKDEWGNISIQTLYTILDILIEANSGFATSEKFFPQPRIVAARNLVKLLSCLLHVMEVSYIQENKPETIKDYETFFKLLAEIMSSEAIELDNKNVSFESREFILFSYGIISFNWDPILLGMMFNAHKEANESNPPHLGVKCQKLRLFNDFGLVIGSLRIDKDTNKPEIWYQGHESVAARLNDHKYPNRLMRVGKYLFPHGSWAFRICPSCRKTSMVVKEIGKNYLNYFGPTILPEFIKFGEELLTHDENDSFKIGVFDALECYECGAIIRFTDTPSIMQSAIKGKKPPLLEEAVNEMGVLLKKADHLIFNGYSLPLDDTIYRSLILMAIADRDSVKNGKLKITVLNNDEKKQKQTWYNRAEMKKELEDKTLDDNSRKLVSNFLYLFKDCDIRFSFRNFIDIMKANPDQKQAIQDILNFN